MKKVITGINLLFLLVIFIITTSALAYADALDNGLIYSLEGEEITINGYKGNSSYIAIPEEINGHTVTSIASLAFQGKTSIKKVTIPETVERIGANPFRKCKNLKTIFTPPTNKHYSTLDGCLYDINKRELISVPDSWYSFTIPSGVRIIGEKAFSGNRLLLSVVIPESVTEIGAYAFSDCTKLVSVNTISCDTLGEGAFLNCFELETINLDGDLKSVPQNAFKGCNNLTSVELPDTITGIDKSAFSGCKSLSIINLPDSLEYLGEAAFSSCSSLREVKIPPRLNAIPETAFYLCSALSNIDFGNVSEIGNSAFRGCSALQKLSLPEGLLKVGTSVFSNCNSLKYVTIPESLTSLSQNMFSACSSLKYLYIPATVNNIDRLSLPSKAFFFLVVEPGSYAERIANDWDYCYFYLNSYDWLDDELEVLLQGNSYAHVSS